MIVFSNNGYHYYTYCYFYLFIFNCATKRPTLVILLIMFKDNC